MFKIKDVFLICLFMLLLIFSLSSCDNLGRSVIGEDDPDPISGWFEILYERVLPIVNPDSPDPTDGKASTYHSIYGGRNSSRWVQDGEDKWTATVFLRYDSKHPYFIWLIDRKVEETYGHQIARKIFMRPEGSTEWIELLCIEKHGLGVEGEWAKFIADKNGIRNPC